MAKFPKISVITPSFNQGRYIKKTIDSVLNQKYPNLEYWVIDGASTDNTIEILKSYGNKFNWISKKDKGQADAINKGIKKTKGEIIAYLNSDDFYLPNALYIIAKYFKENKRAQWVTGDYFIINEKERKMQAYIAAYKKFLRKKPTFERLSIANFIVQPSTFWRRSLIAEVGLFDESLRYCMDYDFWLRIIQKHPLHVLNQRLSFFRIHKNSKGARRYKEQFKEELEVVGRYTSNTLLVFLHKLHAKCTIALYKLLK